MATTAVLTPPGICSFLNLKEPRSIVEGGEPRFGLSLIFDKVAQSRPEFQKLSQAVEAAQKKMWPMKIPPGVRSPFHDGAEKASQYEGYHPGDIYISPWTKEKPGVVDINRQDLLDFADVYAGWTARAIVRPFAYDRGGNKGVGLFLDSVQFLRPGKRLDGRKAASESYPDDESPDEDMV